MKKILFLLVFVIFCFSNIFAQNRELKVIKAIESYKISKAEKIIRRGINVNYLDEDGVPLVCKLIKYPTITKLLIDKGADLNVQNKSGSTPLILAIKYSQDETAKLLIEKGANLDYKNYEGNTALMGVVRSWYIDGYTEIAKLLIKKELI